MPVDRVLLVLMPKPECAEAPEWYDNATHVLYDPKNHQLNEEEVRHWLHGLDVVFTVETPNDWRIPGWCREAGVKLVIQGNPEFVRHGQAGWEHLEHPDAWWWPTPWRTDVLPAGRVMPVPMPDDPPVQHDGLWSRPLRILHVVGKRAFEDRNGTDIFVKAMGFLQQPVEVTMFGLDGELPIPRPSRGVRKVASFPNGFVNHWDMYEHQDLLVLPRRYGGLCLPALEARACGMAVMMPNCGPNETLANILVAPRRTRYLTMAGGRIPLADMNPLDLASAIDELSAGDLRERRVAPPLARWSEWRPKYLQAFRELCS